MLSFLPVVSHMNINLFLFVPNNANVLVFLHNWSRKIQTDLIQVEGNTILTIKPTY